MTNEGPKQQKVNEDTWKETFAAAVSGQIFDTLIFILKKFAIPESTSEEVQKLIDEQMVRLGNAGKEFLPGGYLRSSVEAAVIQHTNRPRQ